MSPMPQVSVGGLQDRKFRYKLVLLGEVAVGKSALVMRFVNDMFIDNYKSTIGSAFLTKTMTMGDIEVMFEIWDTGGQERFCSLAPLFYRGAHAAIIVYDITDENSFTRAQYWVNELKLKVTSDIVIALAGNKADLESNRTISCKTAEQFADQMGLLFTEVSAKTAFNVNNMFIAIANVLPKTDEYLAINQDNRLSQRESIRLEPPKEPTKKAKECCKS